MTNLEWLHSLEPKELGEWFAAEHVDTRAERTCRVDLTEYDELLDAEYVSLSCGHNFEWSNCDIELPNYCPNCGAKVVE